MPYILKLIYHHFDDFLSSPIVILEKVSKFVADDKKKSKITFVGLNLVNNAF